MSFIFFAPPDPPALAAPVGGASGTTSESSTPPLTSLIVSSFGSGMGARAGLSIAQLSAIVSVRACGCSSAFGRVCREVEKLVQDEGEVELYRPAQ